MSARLHALGGTVGQLVRAFAQLIADGPAVTPMYPMLVVEHVVSEPWSSATFEGERHRIDLRVYGSADAIADAFVRLEARLPDAEFDIPGQIVAEAKLLNFAVDPDDTAIAAILTVEVVTVVD